MKKINEILLAVVLCGCILCLFFKCLVTLNELDITNLQKQEEWQKLEYYETLNKIYGE